ncbi:MAG: hypothetical protein ACMUHU_00775 [Thermoplasmatota archaeon]
MTGVNTNNPLSLITFALMTILLMVNVPSGPYASNEIDTLYTHTPSRSYSLDGSGLASEKASTTLFGQAFPGPGGKLGTFMWTGDLDMDGLTDMAVASSEAPGNPEEGNENIGYLYIWLGSSEIPSGGIDLDEVEPDILIRGGHEFSRLLSSIDVGDLNSDGIDDLVLGVSMHPSCGRVFILWGSSGGWPSVIDLYDPGRLAPNGDPYGFTRTEDFMIIGGHLAPVPWPEATYDTGDTVLVDDIDRNGRDDLIFSSPGWHHVVIFWGTGDKFTLGSDMTIIDDQDLNSRFGDSMDLGDIDDDGWADLIVGAPYQVNSTAGKYECGIAFVYLNISRARSGSQFDSFDLAHPTIWGTGSYDRFGWSLLLEDVDGDGFDDILVGSPDADGPQNARNAAGQIFVFKGGSKSSFPRYMDAESSCDIIIYGDRKGAGDDPGDGIGRSFAVGDIDGDGGIELVIGYSRRMNENEVSVGCIAGYETSRVFTTPSAIADLRTLETRFEFWGTTENDNLGYFVEIGDVNNDGAEELLASATAADGVGDTRVDCGEVYLFNGSFISLGDLILSGADVKDDLLNPGGGRIYFNYTFRHSIDPRSVKSAYLVLEPGVLDGRIGLIDDEFLSDASSLTLDVQNSSLTYSGSVGRVSLSVRPGWNLRIDRPYDIDLVVVDDGGAMTTRRFVDRFRVVNQLILDRSARILVDGEVVENMDPWLKRSSIVSFSNLEMLYDRPEKIIAPYGIAYVELYRDGTKVDERLLSSPSTTLTDTVPSSNRVIYTIRTRSALEPPPWQGSPFQVKMVGEAAFEFRVDDDPPMPVEGVFLEPDAGRRSIFDDDREWSIGWSSSAGPELDGGSSVRSFMVSIDGDEPVTSYRAGGLFGSYFNGSDFQQLMFERTDGPVDFSKKAWGLFGPEPDLLWYYSFSIRWDGWFRVPASRMYQFSVSGTDDGNAMLVLDGNTIIPWSDLKTSQNSVQRFLNEGDILPIEVYYYYLTDDLLNAESAFSLRYLDDKGVMVPIPPSELLYPSNSTDFRIGLEDEFTATVTAVDWVGLSSEPATITGYMDNRDPVFNLSAFMPWYGDPAPKVTLGIRDPAVGGIPSSGIDISSIEYRLKERSSDAFQEWTRAGIETTVLEHGIEAPTSVLATFTFDLDPSWRGSVQWRVSDIVGNSVESSTVDIGIDSSGPEFELLSPNIQIVQDEGPNTLIMKVFDRPGSGVAPDTIQYRLDTGSGWSDWTGINVTGSGVEIIFDVVLELPAGTNLVHFSAEDLVGNWGSSLVYTIITEPVTINQPPVPGIKAPVNGSSIKLGNPLLLDASGTRDDSAGPFQNLRFTWISNIDGYLGTGVVLNVYLKNLGEHRIRLYVDDGEFNISTSVYVEVKENEPGPQPDDDDDLTRPEPDYFTPLMISAFLIVLLLLGLFLVYRRYKGRKDEETRLDFVERTDDDLEYELRTEEEEKALGVHVEKDGRSEEEREEERRKLYGE